MELIISHETRQLSFPTTAQRLVFTPCTLIYSVRSYGATTQPKNNDMMKNQTFGCLIPTLNMFYV